MVTTRSEVVRCREVLGQLAADLRATGVPFDPQIELGVMVEVPVLVPVLPDVLPVVDFLSVGTNDLVQYLLAVDRNHEALSGLYTPRHPSMLRLLSELFAYGRRERVPVAVCGEMGADPDNVPLLLALGLRDFSIHPSSLLEVRKAVRGCDFGKLRRRAPSLLRVHDRAAIEAWLSRSRN
jgi:phosphotransferase system enzyme I (PtsI)